jgi:hypothetical protein
MGLNLSNEQIAAELDVDADTLHIMATQLREGEDGDEFHEGHVNTLEGFGSLLRSWLRPPRGISHEKLPLYLGFLSSCITPAVGLRRCWPHSWPCWWLLDSLEVRNVIR